MKRDSSRGRPVTIFLTAGVVFAAAYATSQSAAGPRERLTEDVARSVVQHVAPEVERLRGLSFKVAVPVEVVDDERLREYVLGRLDRFDQQRHLEALQRVYRALGLLPEDMSLVDAVIGVLEEQAGGFYDPAAGTYYLLDDMPSTTASIFTAHELAHALEDQHFDLDRRLREVLADDDRLLAVSAVHEGSAMVLMSVYALQAAMRGELNPEALAALAESEAGRAEKLSALPPVLQRQLLGPYVLGMNFMTRGNLLNAIEGYPIEAANHVMRDGPVSSEQILHPEKYWDREHRDDPVTLHIDGVGRLLGKRWKLEGQGVLGEMTLAPLVGAPTPGLGTAGLQRVGAWTNAAAAGWDGDRWELWVRGEQLVVLLLTAWDSAEDAAEFAEALPRNETLRWRVADDRVAVVAGDAGKKTARLLARMLKPPTRN